MNQNISEFESCYPQYAFDFSEPLGEQLRIYEIDKLISLADELTANFEYRNGGRGRPNRNQTRTHSQCATCHKVLRNDYFYTPPSFVRRNIIYSHCKTCAQQLNEAHYEHSSSTIRKSSLNVWSYLVAECTNCGFHQHASALDLHHVEGEARERKVLLLVDDFVRSRSPYKGEQLLKEVAECTVLCSNCHRMLHAEAIRLPSNGVRPLYRLDVLMKLVRK